MVVVKKQSPPTHKRKGRIIKPGFTSHVVEKVTPIFIKRVMVLRISGDEDIRLAIVVIIAGRNPHVGLLDSILTAGDAFHQRLLSELTVPLVSIKIVKAGIVGDQNVRSSVTVQVLE